MKRIFLLLILGSMGIDVDAMKVRPPRSNEFITTSPKRKTNHRKEKIQTKFVSSLDEYDLKIKPTPSLSDTQKALLETQKITEYLTILALEMTWEQALIELTQDLFEVAYGTKKNELQVLFTALDQGEIEQREEIKVKLQDLPKIKRLFYKYFNWNGAHDE